MKNIIVLLGLSLFLSCGNTETKIDSFSNAEIYDKMRYQVEVFQTNNAEYTTIVLNRLNGKVFIGKNSSGFYQATNKSGIKVYKTPTYSIKIVSFTNGSPQILLNNLQTAEMYMYIVGQTADFYDVVNNLETLDPE